VRGDLALTQVMHEARDIVSLVAANGEVHEVKGYDALMEPHDEKPGKLLGKPVPIKKYFA
jgi:hypothetical protein